MRSYWIRVYPHPMTSIFVRREKFGHRHRKEGHLLSEAEAEIRVMLPRAKEHQESPVVRRGKEGCSPRHFRGNMALPVP